MKKLITLLAVLGITVSLWAELYTPHRFIEFGVDTEEGASNNYFRIDEIFVKKLVIDLQKMSKDLSGSGLKLGFMTDEKVFFNFNRGERFRLGIFTQLEGAGFANAPESLFDLLGKGYKAGDKFSADVEGFADLFFSIGVNFHTTIFEKYGITVTPAYFVPLAYVEKMTAEVSLTSGSDTGIRAEAVAPIDVYSPFSLQKYKENAFSGGDIPSDLGKSLQKGGFDLALEVERPIFRSLDLGVFTRIPLVPATLDHKMSMRAYAYYSVNNLMGVLDDSMETDSDYGMDDFVYTSGESKKVWRPFRFGVEGAWRPFGDWCTFRPMIALVVRNPYTSGARIVYPEYALVAEGMFFNMLGLNVGTSYKNKAFIQQLGLTFNFRVFELNAKVMLRGSSFVSSFNWNGAGAAVGIRFGW